MSLIINHNEVAANATRNLTTHYDGLARSVRRLSSGLRVGTAADDAAGLAIRELMRADVSSLNQGIRNANDAISLIQTADGALSIIDEKLIRMKELAEQAATGTYSSDQRLMIDAEFRAMAAEINRIASATDFNGVKLLDGSLYGEHNGDGLNATGALKVHFGSGNAEEEDYYYVDIPRCDLSGLLGAAGSVGGAPGSGNPILGGNFDVKQVDKNTAVDALTGNGITVTGSKFTGASGQLGQFTDGMDAGFSDALDKGIILSTGNVSESMGSGLASSNMNGGGDPLLDGLLPPGAKTYDAARLDVTFTTTETMIYFNFIFASEEYPEI